MITTLNDKTSLEMREKYTRLFNNAYNDLKAYDEKEGTDYVKDESVFTDLGHYYGHMADYLAIGKPVYIMLPLDESNFHIDTNTREITVPTNFKKCGGVTNDNVCEIITFTVDRYFDFVDLGSADIHIDVQWKNALGEEGYTSVYLIDDETFFEKGLLRFGWPITREITKAEGNVEFAVQFYRGDRGDKTLILNTLSEILPIKKGLTVNLDSLGVDGSAVLDNIVVNGRGTSTDYPTPVMFMDYDPDPREEKEQKLIQINSDDTLTISVLADTADRSDLVYKWYRFRDGEGSKEFNEWDNKHLFSINNQDYRAYNYDTNKEFEYKAFYTYNAGGKVYERYSQNKWPTDGTILYQKYTTLTFNKANGDLSDITGAYYVVASNCKYRYDSEGNPTDVVKAEASQDSIPFNLFKPEPITFKTKPGNHAFIDGKDTPEMTVSFVSSTKLPNYEFNWSGVGASGNLVKDIDFTVKSVQNDGHEYSYCNVKTPGNYTLNVVSTLNRYTENSNTNPANDFTCKVTNHPQGPTFKKSVYGYTFNQPKDCDAWAQDLSSVADTIIGTWSDFDAGDFSIGSEKDLGQYGYVLLKINHDPLNEFESDDLTYDWYYESESDNYKTPHQITDIDVGEQGLVPSIFQLSNKKNYIVLRVVWEDGATRRFYCKVTNTLGGEEVSVNSQPIDIINRAAIGY